RDAPPAGRMLAALVLGALALPPPEPLAAESSLERAYSWGHRRGAPSEPGLLVALLAQSDGTAAAERCLRTLDRPGPFRPSAELLRELLEDGVWAERLAELVAAALAAEAPLARLLGPRPELPPDWDWTTQRVHAARHARGRQDALAALGELLWT